MFDGVDLLVFDLDGTLVDSSADIAASINRTRLGYGLRSLDLSVIRTNLGDGARQLVNRCFSDASVSVDDALDRFRSDYEMHALIDTAAFDGVPETLRVLRDRFRLAVLTNKYRSISVEILEGLQLLDLFDVVVGGDGPCLKPCPEGLNLILQQTGKSPAAAMMIGDHHTDLEAGRRAGVRTLFCDYGFGEIGEERPDYRLAAFPELVNLLLR